MTKVTSQNHGSPQIARVLRDREDQADMEGVQQSGTDAYTLDRVKTDQDLVSIYEIAGESSATSNLSVTFEQVSGEAQFGGAPPRNEPTVGGGGPAAISQAGSQPAVGTVAHSPTTHPFGPNQVQEFTAAQAALDGLTARRMQMVLDIESCSLLLRSNAPAEVSGTAEGMATAKLSRTAAALLCCARPCTANQGALCAPLYGYGDTSRVIWGSGCWMLGVSV
jgi:hypothetical protein